MRKTTGCTETGCINLAASQGYCWTHYHPHYVAGELPPVAVGATKTVAYTTIHVALRAMRGAASIYACALDCGDMAQQWALKHKETLQGHLLQGTYRSHGNTYTGTYSDELSDYMPLCTPCHRDYDRKEVAV